MWYLSIIVVQQQCRILLIYIIIEQCIIWDKKQWLERCNDNDMWRVSNYHIATFLSIQGTIMHIEP